MPRDENTRTSGGALDDRLPTMTLGRTIRRATLSLLIYSSHRFSQKHTSLREVCVTPILNHAAAHFHGRPLTGVRVAAQSYYQVRAGHLGGEDSVPVQEKMRRSRARIIWGNPLDRAAPGGDVRWPAAIRVARRARTSAPVFVFRSLTIALPSSGGARRPVDGVAASTFTGGRSLSGVAREARRTCACVARGEPGDATRRPSAATGAVLRAAVDAPVARDGSRRAPTPPRRRTMRFAISAHSVRGNETGAFGRVAAEVWQHSQTRVSSSASSSIRSFGRGQRACANSLPWPGLRPRSFRRAPPPLLCPSPAAAFYLAPSSPTSRGAPLA